MPNTTPPILLAEDVERYRSEILDAVPDSESFQPLMTIKLTPSTTPRSILGAAGSGAVAGKFYPEGVTTNADGGLRHLKDLMPGVLDAMRDVGMVLCIHGEDPDAFSLERERSFLREVDEVAHSHLDLRVVLEHLSTRAAVEAVEAWPSTIAATLTIHHLYLTLDDVLGAELRPHLFCKPVAKTPDDRNALVDAALSGNPKFFLGTDSAPHTRKAKEFLGAAGVFTAPIAIPLLAQFFDENGHLERLAPFVSEFGSDFYGVRRAMEEVRLVKEPMTVPANYGGNAFHSGQDARFDGVRRTCRGKSTRIRADSGGGSQLPFICSTALQLRLCAA